jgi:hypothetical protein
MRYDSSMIACSRCGAKFVASGRRRYCSDACKQADWRMRRAGAADPAPVRVRPEATIYECPSCEERYLGVRRCEPCGLFCRKVGPGGSCPHCEGPIAYEDLV